MNNEALDQRSVARACGAEPPFMWGFDQNEPVFRP